MWIVQNLHRGLGTCLVVVVHYFQDWASVTLKVKSLLFRFKSNRRPTYNYNYNHLCYFSPRTTWCASMLTPQSIWQRKNSGQLLRQGPLLTSLLQMKRQGNWRSQIWIFRSTETHQMSLAEKILRPQNLPAAVGTSTDLCIFSSKH